MSHHMSAYKHALHPHMGGGGVEYYFVDKTYLTITLGFTMYAKV